MKEVTVADIVRAVEEMERQKLAKEYAADNAKIRALQRELKQMRAEMAAAQRRDYPLYVAGNLSSEVPEPCQGCPEVQVA